jgi:hypothetical protein
MFVHRKAKTDAGYWAFVSSISSSGGAADVRVEPDVSEIRQLRAACYSLPYKNTAMYERGEVQGRR